MRPGRRHSRESPEAGGINRISKRFVGRLGESVQFQMPQAHSKQGNLVQKDQIED